MTTGLLVVDKPEGATSHDVVAWARRALGTRAIGHSGTLDPFATGVLVLCVGEATKLASYVMAGEKEYEATLVLGAETDTLDATGAVTESAPVPPLDRVAFERALGGFVGPSLQVPPAFSAIKEGGVPLHRRARRGEVVAPAPRSVVCRALQLLDVTGGARPVLRLRIVCEAGYYVRSLGRDLAVALGTRGHLAALRRTRSGRHLAATALPGDVVRRARDDEGARAAVRGALLPITPESSPLPALPVDDEIAAMLATGKRPPAPAGGGPSGPELAFRGLEPVAIVERRDGLLRVVRGLRPAS